tara:strand:+ start:6482 stop:7069 length:588 start_codon:yes stop_codon:yes gene_type:complete
MNSKRKRIVAVNNFVKRQKKYSGKTYAKTLTFEDIAYHAELQMGDAAFSKGYREGVRVVHADKSIVNDFVCPYVLINENTELVSKVVKRNDLEEPYIQTRALNGERLETGNVDLILYRNDVLKENNENTTNTKWELISFNAIPKGVESFPIGPVTMMRNQLCLIGGTKGKYSSEKWAQSVRFYQKILPIQPKDDI